jgi:N,N'-diacetyllegionaminate synthase
LGAEIFVDDRRIGFGNPCFVIAEVGQAHDGSLGAARAYIDAAARAGADAVKFQTHIAAEESTPAEPWRVKFSSQDATRYDYWKRMEFSEGAWAELAAHANERGIAFLSSAFSSAAVELLERIGMPAWKVASGEITNMPLLERMAATKNPVLLSSGMAHWSELDDAIEAVTAAGAPVGVFQTTSAYPCPPDRLGLNVLGQLRERYDCPVGLSDHSAAIFAGLAAVSLGANMLEVHLVFSRECFGPDTSSSLVPDELAQLVTGIRFIESALANPVDKDAAADAMLPMRSLFTKSIVVRHELDAGALLTDDDLALKKPGTGLPASYLPNVIGRRLKRAVGADTLLTEDDLV